MGCTQSLEPDEQLVLKNRQGVRSEIRGEGRKLIGCCMDVVEHRRKVVLEEAQYAIITHNISGERRLVNGPATQWLGANEKYKIEASTILSTNEYLILKNNQTGALRCVYGPGAVTLQDHEVFEGQTHKTPVLQQGEFCKIRDEETGTVSVICGPTVIKLGPKQSHDRIQKLPLLKLGEYCRIKDEKTGHVRLITGPKIVSLGPFDCVHEKVTKLPVLQRGEYCKVQDNKEGHVRVCYGPSIVMLGPYESVDEILKCPELSGEEYLVVRNESEGTQVNIIGPTLFMPGEFDVFDKPLPVIILCHDEYVKIRDSEGAVRIEQGEKRVIPDPLDEVMDGGKKQALRVDQHNAVLVRNTDNGSLELVTKHGLFFPTAYQEVVEPRKKIILEESQSVVCKDASGRFYYASGDTTLSDNERGPGPDFFLPPHHELVTASWSTDLRKEHATSEEVWKFDSRPSYMSYEFECRTLDNVTLIIDVSFFWRIVDVRSMISSTNDAPGDTCTHARSMIMADISRVKLMDFLGSFNAIISSACLNDEFYSQRGIDLISAEVLKFSCASSETDAVLQDIIKETCDRLKFKERQKGENEVSLERLDGEIEEEKLRQKLIEVKKGHLKVEAKIEGEAEGIEVSGFLEKLASTETAKGRIGMENAVSIFQTQQRHKFELESAAALANGSSNLVVVPKGVNLRLGEP